MRILFLGGDTVCMYAILPTFRRSLLFSSSRRSLGGAYVCLGGAGESDFSFHTRIWVQAEANSEMLSQQKCNAFLLYRSTG
jgi:hypothetical protein